MVRFGEDVLASKTLTVRYGAARMRVFHDPTMRCGRVVWSLDQFQTNGQHVPDF